MPNGPESPPARRLVDVVHRPTVGILTVVLIAIGLASATFAPSTSLNDQLTSAGLRIGMVLGVLWLALPDLRKARRSWPIVLLVVICVAIFVLPRRVPIAKLVPLLIIAWLALTVLRGRPFAAKRR
ncbi:MAG TPA: hypothetical protein VHV77_03880 [Pirellulales bacterium]|nr:hypothetical protein [Pirellulales bacterium]